MIDIYIVEYQCSDVSDLIAFPVRAFKSEQKAKDFVEECKKECKRIDLEVKKYWEKHQVEYLGLSEVISRRARKAMNVDTRSKEFKRKEEIAAGERKIIDSHKIHRDCVRQREAAYYDISEVTLDEDEE